jgi:hypothetical protein
VKVCSGTGSILERLCTSPHSRHSSRRLHAASAIFAFAWVAGSCADAVSILLCRFAGKPSNSHFRPRPVLSGAPEAQAGESTIFPNWELGACKSAPAKEKAYQRTNSAARDTILIIQLCASPTFADNLSGQASIIDGDTLRFTGRAFAFGALMRLRAIPLPGRGQHSISMWGQGRK